MGGTDITVLCRTPVLPVNGRNPAPTAIIVSREAVERQRAPFSQAINALDYMVKTHALPPSLTPQGGILVSCGMGRNGRSGRLSHSNDMIGACNDVHVCGSAHCGCVVNGSVAF